MRRQSAIEKSGIKTITIVAAAGMLAAAAAVCAPEAMAQNGTDDDAGAQIEVQGVVVTSPVIEHSGDFLRVGADLDLTGLDVKGNRAVLLTPHLVNETDSLELPSVGIYGRQRYLYYERNHTTPTAAEDTYRAKDAPDGLNYSEVLEYPAWAKGTQLSLHLRWSLYGCCNGLIDEQDGLVYTEAVAFYPELVYVRPQGNTLKERSLSGSARVEFVVDKTDIRPTYRNNAYELGKIIATIDSVKNDADVTVTRIFLKGYASPESPYSHNTDLAKGRTAAVKEYVKGLYSFPESIFETDYEPEDWEGLRDYVQSCLALTHRDGILALIDGDLEPDAKEWKIKSTYPEDYAYLLRNCYPALRHTYYEVHYDVRTYTSIEEIKRVFATRPGNLSLNELYLLSQEYEPGSEEFLEVFETAARLYPEDASANLNAANAELRRFETGKAERYLAKAGDSGEAEYARGVCAYWESDYDEAVEHFSKAKDAGVEQAGEVLETLENVDRDKVEAARKAAILDVLNAK